MAIGIYKAWKRKAEITSPEPVVFTNNIQVLLSVFAFSTFVISNSTIFIVWLFAQMGASLMLAY